MARACTRVVSCITAISLLAGCSDNPQQEDESVRVEQEVNVCNVTVAANLIVDGIPAYDQCSASNSAAIYSNNGVDTATTAVSSDWKRTQFSGGYQCTELLHRYWMFRWNIDWEPNGDAGTWCDRTPPSSSGIVQTTTPVHGDAMVFGPGVCGSGSVGHVTLIDTVDSANSKATFIEQNSVGRRTAAWTCASCFLHVVANDGSAGAPNTAGAGGTSSAGSTTTITGGRAASGGRSSSGGTWMGTATGGSSTNTGGRAASGGRTGVGGGATMASGGAATGGAVTGGRAANSGGRVGTGGLVVSGGTAAGFGGRVNASGGSMPYVTTASTRNTGGTSLAQTSTAVGDTGGNSAGGTQALGASSDSSAGSAVDAQNTTAAAGQSSVQAVNDTDPGSCSCRVPNGRSSTPAGLGIGGFALFFLIRLRRRRG